MSSFATMEKRMNRTAARRLSNASATWWKGGIDMSAPVLDVRLVFDRENMGFADDAVNDANPVCSVLDEDAPGVDHKSVLRITRDGHGDSMFYTVLRAIPDGTGWIQLHLREGTV